MNLEARKLEFIQDFLKLQSEDAIGRLERYLKQEKEAFKELVSEPMSHDELNKRVEQSESDFKNNRFNDSHTLLAKYK